MAEILSFSLSLVILYIEILFIAERFSLLYYIFIDIAITFHIDIY
jgi:hypothetical protein